MLEMLENTKIWRVCEAQVAGARPPQEHTDFKRICFRDQVRCCCPRHESGTVRRWKGNLRKSFQIQGQERPSINLIITIPRRIKEKGRNGVTPQIITGTGLWGNLALKSQNCIELPKLNKNFLRQPALCWIKKHYKLARVKNWVVNISSWETIVVVLIKIFKRIIDQHIISKTWRLRNKKLRLCKYNSSREKTSNRWRPKQTDKPIVYSVHRVFERQITSKLNLVKC